MSLVRSSTHSLAITMTGSSFDIDLNDEALREKARTSLNLNSEFASIDGALESQWNLGCQRPLPREIPAHLKTPPASFGILFQED